jgi:hypothetical protein
MFANNFCKHFRVSDPPDVIKKYRSLRSYPARLARSLYMYISRKLSWAHIRKGVREASDEYGLLTIQMALANPPDDLRSPGLAVFIRNSQQEVKAWLREHIAKQHRHERNTFIMEFLILLFVFVEVSDRLISIVKSWVHFP